MARPFAPLSLVAGVAATMVDELAAIAKSRTLTPLEAAQCATMGTLADALLAAARHEAIPLEFTAAFAPLRGLFAEADAAAREGGIAVPSKAARHPFPVTPEALAWFGVSSFVDCLVLITRNATVSPTAWKRLRQLEILAELQAVLAGLAQTGPGDPAAVARMQELWIAAEQIIADELPAIVAEATTTATAAAGGRPN